METEWRGHSIDIRVHSFVHLWFGYWWNRAAGYMDILKEETSISNEVSSKAYTFILLRL
jgi:hypothetical protein